ncbi:hypothetical protein BVRB_8g188270 [Beta vulgaris subsp. vulgaris]|nr:hypothetical protein BVRB_8g188270 [Beta vulgaris subsp. vulgaris]
MWRSNSVILVLITCFALVSGEPKVPCHFIFGDTLSDPGNNNKFLTIAKANYPPYGVDFPRGIPTGRFTNGRNIADFLTQYLGFEKLTTPYENQMSQDILKGVNFASGVGGILTVTGIHVGDRVWMDRQILNYKTTITKLQSMVEGPVANYLNKCLYTINLGSEDYVNNYFMPLLYPTKKLLNKNQFAELLIARYREQLQTLYNSGARKIAIFGLFPIGCTPAEITKNNGTQCNEEINQAVEIFNKKLVSLADYFNGKHPEARFTFINFAAIQAQIPLPQGSITNSTCCKLGITFLCAPFAPPCPDRNLYAFMDGYHPTEALNEIVANISFNSTNPIFVHPMNIKEVIGRLT